MNIFILHRDPVKAAQMYCDKHVPKMIVELAQQLSCAHHIHDSDIKDVVYKKTHVNHPCSVWCRETSANYEWTYQHFIALCLEFTIRFKKIHLTEKKLKILLFNNPCPKGPLTKFAQAMPEEYRHSNAVKAYRDYYLNDKKDFATWKYSLKPYWWK